LKGLPLVESLQLIEGEFGQRLNDEERMVAQMLHEALAGNPLRLLQAAAIAKEVGETFLEGAARFTLSAPIEAVTNQAIAALPEKERRVLLVMAAVNGRPLAVGAIAAVIGQVEGAPPLIGSQVVPDFIPEQAIPESEVRDVCAHCAAALSDRS
jgi:hypothetical protein